MQIAALVLLEPGAAVDLDAARALVKQRLGRVPRLRQRLVGAPIGCGRPYWVDDADFDATRHIHVVGCGDPGDEAALLDAALAVVVRPLDRSRPMWSATFVTGLADGRVALVVVLHHVVADGMGGLAVLGELVDAGLVPRELPEFGFPRPAPSRRALVLDAWTTRVRALSRAPELLRQLAAGVTELGSPRAGAPRTSFNQPAGSRRAACVVRADLAVVITAAHAHGGTVNDVILTAVTGALGGLLAARGDVVPSLVVSVPVSGRATASGVDLGNRVGAMPMALPIVGDPVTRLRSVAAITRTRKQAKPGASAALLQPLFRAMAVLGVLSWFINRQRVVNTFVTNVRGPAVPLTFMGATITEIIPISGIAGNATVAFAAMSYRGALTVTVMVDPDAVPELAMVAAALHDELEALSRQ